MKRLLNLSAGQRLEDLASIIVLAAMTALPIGQLIAREWFNSGWPGSIAIVQHMTMWISFLGAALAARSDKLLALSTTRFLPGALRDASTIFVAMLAVAINALLVIAGAQLTRIDRSFGDEAAWGIPVWAFTAVIPLALALITLRMIWHSSASMTLRVVAALGLVAALLLVFVPGDYAGQLVWPLGLLLLAGTVLGLPIYCALGGIALVLFWAEGTPISAVPGEAYRLSTSAMLPAIPLFTLAGYVLAQGGSSHRLLRLFSALVGWMPGGIAVAVTLILAFFTPLTGASGITILAMGGLLLPLLLEKGYKREHSLGLVTVSGSIGIFLPPSLPVILYAYYAELDFNELLVAGIVPGLLLIIAVAGFGALRGSKATFARTPFDWRELGLALWQAKWEVMLPVVILTGIFGGFSTLVEASALTVCYALLVECVVFKELTWRRDIARIVVESATMIGGFMIILSFALGLTNYLIIAQIPMLILNWVSELIDSPLVFLLTLNVLLIVVGALMDIYSAIIVIVPLIAPLAAAYGINPLHLGVIFLANMELGYLMPPMGENLFLSAYRFEETLGKLYRDVLPFVLLILAVVLLITYVPQISLWLPGVF